MGPSLTIGKGSAAQGTAQLLPTAADVPRPRRFPAFSTESLTGSGLKWADLLVMTIALMAVTLPAYFEQTVRNPSEFLALRLSVKNMMVLGLCWLFWTSVLHLAGLYEAQRILSRQSLALRLYTAVGCCSFITLFMLHVRHKGYGIVEPLFIFFASSLLLTGMARLGSVVFDLLVRPHLRRTRRALIVGTDMRARELLVKLYADREYAYDIVGLVDPETPTGGTVLGLPLLGSIRNLEDLLMREHIDEVLVALPVRTFYEEIREVLELCEASGVRSQYLSDIFPLSVTKRRETGGRDAERVVLHMVHTDLRLTVKRAVDVFGACFGLVFLAPVFLLISTLR